MLERSLGPLAAVRPNSSGRHERVINSFSHIIAGALQNIAQFANIARPRVAHENVEHFRADAADVFAVFGVDVTQDMLDEQRNVFFVFAQRRQIDVENVQAEI